VSRADNVIISSGYRIGPEEVEETLLNHPAVEEAAVVGKDHDTRGEIVAAYVTLVSDYEPSAELEDELSDFAREELSKHEYPREIAFIDELPKTTARKDQTGRTRGLDSHEPKLVCPSFSRIKVGSPMHIDPHEDSHSVYWTLTGLVVPRPIGWISTRSEAGVDNLAPTVSSTSSASIHRSSCSLRSTGRTASRIPRSMFRRPRSSSPTSLPTSSPRR